MKCCAATVSATSSSSSATSSDTLNQQCLSHSQAPSPFEGSHWATRYAGSAQRSRKMLSDDPSSQAAPQARIAGSLWDRWRYTDRMRDDVRIACRVMYLLQYVAHRGGTRVDVYKNTYHFSTMTSSYKYMIKQLDARYKRRTRQDQRRIIQEQTKSPSETLLFFLPGQLEADILVVCAGICRYARHSLVAGIYDM
jgi:uncharacterized protein (DUF885 family)